VRAQKSETVDVDREWEMGRMKRREMIITVSGGRCAMARCVRWERQNEGAGPCAEEGTIQSWLISLPPIISVSKEASSVDPLMACCKVF
jgi:hypothetical protein